MSVQRTIRGFIICLIYLIRKMNKVKEIPLIKIHKEVLEEVGLYWTIQETVGELLMKANNSTSDVMDKVVKPNKDKLGDSFTKFLESEGYEVIDCKTK